MATLSGPDTYYEFRGAGFGPQYVLASAFASHLGARLRMELAPDTAALIARLIAGEADVIAIDFPDPSHAAASALPDSVQASIVRCSSRWLVRRTAAGLAAAINEWYSDDLRHTLLAAADARQKGATQPRRRRQSAVLDRAGHRLSRYDTLFKRYAPTIGWDWRLLAAQCYQESGFDAHATSWAGAQGLMQLMPATAARFGLTPTTVFEPEGNIRAAVSYLHHLELLFADIDHPQERLCFVLAAYNGGDGHVRDAMRLAVRDGFDSSRWQTVEPYIRKLTLPRYYRDPMVRYGYLRGDETAGYVSDILARWRQYRNIADGTPISRPSASPSQSLVRPRSYFELRDSLSDVPSAHS